MKLFRYCLLMLAMIAMTSAGMQAAELGIGTEHPLSPEVHHQRPVHRIQLGRNRVAVLGGGWKVQSGDRGIRRHEGVGRQPLFASSGVVNDFPPFSDRVGG